MSQIKNVGLAGVLALSLFFMGGVATAAVKCDFTRDLEVGMEGEDVRCLQQYLNSQGFVVATEGVGSVGKETTQFKDLTKKAVMSWQTAQGITPATGYFGSLSRAKYAALANGATTPPTTTPPTTTPPVTTPPVTPPSSTDTEISLLKQQIASLTARLDELERDLEDALEDSDNGDEDEDEDEDEDGEETEAEDAIEDAQDAIDEAWEAVDEADEDGEDTDDAEDLLEEAEELLEEAEEALDDEDWDEAIELAEEAEDLAGDAEDEL
ncbi:MAG TPA: peptidoglycan-binding domain-containing protein [Candidatus Paceibacterota bacterium]|jgi:tetratricopeptide (TPR) repeat protein